VRAASMVSVLCFAGMCVFGSASGAKEMVKKGEDFPGFGIRDLNGRFYFLREHVGPQAKNPEKAILFSFCQSTCKPCRKEVPELEKTLKIFGPLGLVIYMVNVGEDEKKARELSNELKTSIPFLVDRYGVVFKLAGGTATPLTILVDGAGKVRYVRPGFSEEKAEEIRAELERAIADILGAGGTPSSR
jgi:thiol-disulfide isomerase/thioredoxin